MQSMFVVVYQCFGTAYLSHNFSKQLQTYAT